MIYTEDGDYISLNRALPEYKKHIPSRCYGSYVPKILKVTKTPKTIKEIYEELAISRRDRMLISTIKWLEENNRLSVGPDKNKKTTYVSK
jgi:hypothetical protein